jgi:hypothetical protein
MSVIGLNRVDFHSIAIQILENGHHLRFQANGRSMQPFIQDKDILEVAPLAGKRIHCGDVLLVSAGEGRLLAHRVVKMDHHGGISIYLIKSDVNASPDGWYRSENILGRVELVNRGTKQIILTSTLRQLKSRLWVMIIPWKSKMSWLPERLRQGVWNWLLVS